MVINFIKSGYRKVRDAMSRTRGALGERLKGLFGRKLDETALEELEQLLYEADLGAQTAAELTDYIRQAYKRGECEGERGLVECLKAQIVRLLGEHDLGFSESARANDPVVALIVGVNGNGKTTSVAKLAKRLKSEGKSVLVGAADTFRAAAVDQLSLWAKQIGVDVVKGRSGSDPAAIAFDAVTAAKARGVDVVLLDTAGRLHTKIDLMEELKKIRRVCHKVVPGSPQETLLVLDATTGQNAIDQAVVFHTFTPMTGLVLTKLDGTAKGGIVVGVQKKLNIPVKFIGVGEGEDDLLPFDPKGFTESLFSDPI